MKFSCSIEINRSREDVVRLWIDPTHFDKWQEGYHQSKVIDGNQGSTGSKTLLVYQQGKRTMELLESVIVNELPERYEGLYEHKHMVNTMTTTFNIISDEVTKMESEIEYIEFRHLIPRLMSWLMPGMFKKQVQKWMNNFKAFAEAEE